MTRSTESDAYEATVHEHSCAKKPGILSTLVSVEDNGNHIFCEHTIGQKVSTLCVLNMHGRMKNYVTKHNPTIAYLLLLIIFKYDDLYWINTIGEVKAF